jgi:hypothetical protein
MEKSNSSVGLLYLSLSCFMLWGFIASIILPDEYSHYGLSLSAVIASIMICYCYHRTFLSTAIPRKQIEQKFTINDILDCYKLAACITTNHKEIYKRGARKRVTSVQEELKLISIRKSVKLERDLKRRGVCSRIDCGGQEQRRYKEMSEKLKKLHIESTPELAELREYEETLFNDLVYIQQMQEFAAFSHMVNV